MFFSVQGKTKSLITLMAIPLIIAGVIFVLSLLFRTIGTIGCLNVIRQASREYIETISLLDITQESVNTAEDIILVYFHHLLKLLRHMTMPHGNISENMQL